MTKCYSCGQRSLFRFGLPGAAGGKVVFAASAQAVRVKVAVLLLSLTLYRLIVTTEFIICLMCFNLHYPTQRNTN